MNLVTDIGRIDDGTFNQQSYDSMRGQRVLRLRDDYIETVSEADYATNISTTLARNPKS